MPELFIVAPDEHIINSTFFEPDGRQAIGLSMRLADQGEPDVSTIRRHVRCPTGKQLWSATQDFCAIRKRALFACRNLAEDRNLHPPVYQAAETPSPAGLDEGERLQAVARRSCHVEQTLDDAAPCERLFSRAAGGCARFTPIQFAESS